MAVRRWVGLCAATGLLLLLAPAAHAADPPPAPGVPRQVAAATKAGTLTVGWQPPLGGGPVSGYAVACTSTDGGAARSATTGASARSLALALPDNRTYSCTVTAKGPGGTSGPARSAYVMHAVISRAGGTAPMHLPMVAGQGVSAAAARSTLGADCSSGNLETLAPGGGALNEACLVSGVAFVDGRNVTSRGQGSATLIAGDGRHGSAELTAWVYTDDRKPISIGGATVPVRTTQPGQNAVLSFSASAGRRVSVDLTGVTVPGGVTLSVVDPSGSTLAVVGTTGRTGYLDTVALPRTGTYTVVVDPSARTSGSAVVRLNNVPPDSTGKITVNGPAATVVVTAPGQNGVRTFAGHVGQRLVLTASANTIPGVTLRILAPDGGEIQVFGLSSAGGSSEPVTLSTTGSYQVVVDPDAKATGRVAVRVHT